MPWDNVACCADCWDRDHPDKPAPRGDHAKTVWHPDRGCYVIASDTTPRFPDDPVTACCWYCAGPIYGGILYVREQVEVKSTD